MARRGRRRDRRPGRSGFLVVDKPAGVTSHDVVDCARRWFGTRRVGHLGTLDPLATGVLPLAVRDATKLVPFVPSGRKVYVGTIELGRTTDTYDAEGEVTAVHDGALPDEAALRAALEGFRGTQSQVPPMYSAVKHEGEPLHRRARRGETVEREAREVEIFEIVLHGYEPPRLHLEVACSPGTYVRSLADDLGRALGCGAHLAGLRRTVSGPFDESQSVTVDVMDGLGDEEADARLLRPAEALGLPIVTLREPDARRVAHGADVPTPPVAGRPPRPGARVAALGEDGSLVAVMELRPDRRLHPLRVLLPVAPQG